MLQNLKFHSFIMIVQVLAMLATETTSEIVKKKKVKKTDSANNSHVDDDFVIKPSNKTQSLDTSEWPILLKNYDRLNVRTGHYTPLTEGHSPTKRPLGKHVDQIYYMVLLYMLFYYVTSIHEALKFLYISLIQH